MKREDFIHHQDVIEAWVNGAEIQFYSELFDKWYDTDSPDWDSSTQYRIKRYEPKQCERVEVSIDGETWCERTYIFSDDHHVWAITEDGNGFTIQQNNETGYKLNLVGWKYVRPLKK